MFGENWTYLCGVLKDYEADIIIGLLNEENISVVKQYPEAGEFLKVAYGFSHGVDLFVPAESLADALLLLQNARENINWEVVENVDSNVYDGKDQIAEFSENGENLIEENENLGNENGHDGERIKKGKTVPDGTVSTSKGRILTLFWVIFLVGLILVITFLYSEYLT